MAKIVVLPRIEIDNPFGSLINILAKEAIPFVRQLAMNKEQIAKLSDVELTDHIPILKQHAPDLLTQDGKIDWNKVEEYANSDDLFKQRIAHYLKQAKQMREEFANLPIGVKLEKMLFYTKGTDPLVLQKEFVIKNVIEKYNEIIDQTDLPEDIKLQLRAFSPELAELFAQNPTKVIVFLKVLERSYSKKKQDTAQQEGGAGSWRLSLDEQGQKRFGIRLEDPQLTPPQVNPPQIPMVSGQKPVAKPVQKGSVSQSEQKPTVKQNEQRPADKRETNQLPFDPNYRPKEPGLLPAPDLVDLLTYGAAVGLGALGAWLASRTGLRAVGEGLKRTAGRVIGKVGGMVKRGAKKETQQATENIAKETAEKTASQQVKFEPYSVVGQLNKYDARRQELKKRIEEQMKKFVEERDKRLPVLAQKPQQGEIVDKKVRLADYVNYDPFTRRRIMDAERVPIAKYARQIAEQERQKRLPVPVKTQELAKQVEQLKRLVEDYKNFQKQTEKLERELGINKTTTEKIKEALEKTTDPQRKESLKKLLELSQRLDDIERQLRKEYETFLKTSQTKAAKVLKSEARPIKPEQIEKAKPHRLMRPTEQVLREELYQSSLKPVQEKAEELRKVDELVRQLLDPHKKIQSTKPKKKKSNK
jgi:hypothetical protein